MDWFDGLPRNCAGMPIEGRSGLICCRRSRPGEVNARATTRLLDRLAAKGMCRRHRDDADRRSVQLEITELGQSALEVTESTVSAVMVEWFSGVEGSDLEIVRRVLSKMLAARR